MHTPQNTSSVAQTPTIVWFADGDIAKKESVCFACGGYADVWRASNAKKNVAVKVWRGASFDPDSRQQFTKRLTKELMIWSRLRHRNVVPFYGLTTDYGHLPALVLPYYQNGTVLECLRENPSMNIISLALDIAAALSYLHNQPTPVVHGDLKGSNIFVNDHGEACVGDFGLSSIVGDSNFTTANIAGSCRWMAPEVMQPVHDSDSLSVSVSTRSDVYSFAMTIIEMFTGRAPFNHRRNDAAVIFEVIGGGRPRRPALADCPQITNDVWALLEACWAQAPGERPSIDAIGYWLQLITSDEVFT